MVMRFFCQDVCIKLTLQLFSVSHVLVLSSCHHEGLDRPGAHTGLCLFTREAIQPGCLQGEGLIQVVFPINVKLISF